MQLYVALRGQKMFLDNFITELQGKYTTIKLKVDKNGAPCADGEEKTLAIQLGVRPIQLYEIAFPKEHKDLILTTVLGEKPMRDEYSRFSKYLMFFRKILGLKPIEKYDTQKALPITRESVDVIGIGIREDKEHPFGEGI